LRGLSLFACALAKAAIDRNQPMFEIGFADLFHQRLHTTKIVLRFADTGIFRMRRGNRVVFRDLLAFQCIS
jgi:hypothetical protein